MADKMHDCHWYMIIMMHDCHAVGFFMLDFSNCFAHFMNHYFFLIIIFKVLLGECLGELGAVDPGRIAVVLRASERGKAHIVLSVLDTAVGSALIGTHLMSAFLSATSPR
jgi:hypothetical protein